MGSFWVVLGRFESFWFVPRFSKYEYILKNNFPPDF